MSKKIIYVDTSENMSEEWYNEFLKNGYEVTYAGDDGEYAIQRILSVKPEILVVNMFLKRTDGCGVMRTVKRVLPEMKIVAIGSSNEQMLRTRHIDAYRHPSHAWFVPHPHRSVQD